MVYRVSRTSIGLVCGSEVSWLVLSGPGRFWEGEGSAFRHQPKARLRRTSLLVNHDMVLLKACADTEKPALQHPKRLGNYARTLNPKPQTPNPKPTPQCLPGALKPLKGPQP